MSGTFADRLTALRTEWMLSVVELAELAHVRPSVVYNLEAGRAHPSYETLIALSKALCVSTDYLCGLVERHAAVA